MKKMLKRSLSLLLAVALIFSSMYVGLSEVDFGGLFVVRAKAVEYIHPLDFDLSSDGTYYSVSADPNYFIEGENVSTDLIIPDTYNGLPVTQIGNDSLLFSKGFEGCEFTSVVIPDSVTYIGYNAFRNCQYLESVTIGSGVTDIGRSAFQGCTSLKSINLPDSLTSIGSYAFSNCISLTSIAIPESVTSIGGAAFKGCKKLESLNIPESVTSIGENAFEGCTNLQTITLSQGLTTIVEETFKGCTHLQSIDIPSAVTTIGVSAFSDCTSLTSVTIPGSVNSIGNSAFYNCTSLTSVIIPDSVTTIGEAAFDSCTNLEYIFYTGTQEQWESIAIDTNNTGVNFSSVHYEATDHTFELVTDRTATCTEKGIVYEKCIVCGLIKNTIETPAQGHNYSTVWTTDVVATCTTPGSKSRHCINCAAKTDIVEIPALEHSYTYTFDYANNTKTGKCTKCGESITGEISIDDVLKFTLSEDSTYYSITDCDDNVVGHVEIPAYYKGLPVKKIATGSLIGMGFRNCKKITSITIPDTIIEISASAFSSCDNIKAVYISDMDSWCNISFGNLYSNPMRNGADLYVDGVKLTCLVIPSGTTEIPDYAFYGCASIISVEIPDSVTSIGTCAFGKCENLITISLPEGLTTIGSSAFSGCKNLTSVNIPENITVIGSSVFSGCSNLANIVIPDNIESIGTNAFYGCDSLASVVVNGNGETTIGIDAFSSCDNLKTVTLNGVKSICEEAFDCCKSLVSVSFGDCLTTIGEQAFVGCSSLQRIDIPYGITKIERETFGDCRKLTTVTLPDTLTHIASGAFVSCVKLSEIQIPDSVEIIDEYAFLECGSLTSIEIPKGVTSIGVGALAMCRKLKTVKLSESITALPDMLFYECSSLESIVISDKITSIGADCFTECIDFKYIFYAGSETQWNEIEKSDANEYSTEYFDEAIIHYNSTDHTYEWRTTQEASCTSHGMKVEECTCCGLQRDTEVVSALGHSYSDWVIDSKFTCETDGMRYRTCSNCGDVETITEIATGHEFSEEWTIDVAAQCLTDGEKSHHCKNCNVRKDVTIIEAVGHNYDTRWTIDVEPTCTEDGEKSHQCLNCHDRKDITVITATGHSFSEWIVDLEATCFEAGLKYQECENCNEKYYEEIPAGNHMYSGWKVVEKATCDTDGLKTRICNICENEESVAIASYGHNYSASWTIDVAPTCTEDGMKSHHCINCESTKDATQIAPTGHSYGVWIFDNEATCETNGARHRLCENCGDKELQEILALGHQYATMWTIDVEPTCSATGEKSHHCLRCDDKTDIEEIPYGGHIFGKWYVVTQPTMDEAGVRAHKCYNCEMTEEAELPKLFKYTATFVADGDVVATVDFPEGATEIEIPEVPHKDKFNGEWENFDVRNKNFTVNAVYTPIPTEQIDGITAGNTTDYYSSTGEVEINLNVSAPGRTIVTTTTKAVPLDIIFVLDQSGSMADGDKKAALKNAVSSFSNEILADAIANSVDHRIAVVGFASGSNNNLNYQNTELLTADAVKYNRITNADYQNALVSVNDNGELNEVIADAVDEIDAEGATKADLGLEMASSIFANNPVTGDRQRVVVFLTDGVPTSYSNFEYGVANAAIQNAYQLKNTYDATVYSVGVFDDETSANRSVNNFMNYVSSNYNEEKVLKKNSTETSENTNGYYLNVNDASTLSDVFTSIVEETTTHTGRFTNATLKYTLTKYFTLTSVQEDAIRSNAIQTLGVTNEQIVITRNADGTTTIVISGVEPWANGEEFVIDFAFRATANGNTLKSGTYQVGTFESGVILENGEGYEAVFAPNSVDIGGTSGIAVFNINSVPYAINRLSSTTKVVAPATSFGADYNFIGWTVPANLTLNNEVRVFDAELLKNEYKISWNIDGEIIEEIYAVGDFIAVPEVSNNSIGGAFVGWDKVIPETMPSENLTITAIYDAHYHKYDVTKDFKLCTEGGTLTYICECGDTYTEEIAPCDHTWEAITGATSHQNQHNVGFRCSVCGVQDNKDLELERTDKKENADNSHNTATYEFDYVDENGDKHQPDGEVEISVQLDDVFEGDIPENANASVYRVNDDGSRTKLPCEQDGMNVTFTTDHFSTYEFEFTTGEQKYLFAQSGSEIDYENKIIFSDTYGAKEFKSLVTYLAPATLKSNPNNYGYFGTGTSVDLANGDMLDNFKVIINGDLNGDGVCDVLDASYAALVSSGKRTATTDEIYAANGEIAEEIDVLDYQAIVNKALVS